MSKFKKIEQFKNAWKEHRDRHGIINQLNKSDMEAIIRKQTNDTNAKFSRIYIFAMFFQSLGLAFLAVDMFKYGALPELKYATAVAIIILLFIFIYTVNQYHKLKMSDMQSRSISESLSTKISFYKTSFRIWLVPFAFSIVLLTFAVNLYTAGYSFPMTIHEGYRLLLVYLAAFLMMYFSARFSYATYLKSYSIYLNDLQTGELHNVRKETRKYRTITKIIILAIALLVLLGMMVLIFMI